MKEMFGTKLSGRFLPHGLEHSLHFFPLLLGQIVRSDSFLQEFQATLLLTNSNGREDVKQQGYK